MPLKGLNKIRIFAVSIVVMSTAGLVRITRQLNKIMTVAAHQSGDSLIHICFCTDDTDLQGIVVAIKSTVLSASDPTRLVFHIITTWNLASAHGELLRAHLPGVHFTFHHNGMLQSKIQALVMSENDSEPQDRQTSRFMLAPFFFREFLNGDPADQIDTQRVVYLDSDVVVRGDILELYNMDLHGKAVAAATDCLYLYGDIFDWKHLAKISLGDPNLKACTVKNGIFVVDVPRWEKLKIPQAIEDWAPQFRDSEHWKAKLSQLPWLLVADKASHLELSQEWNCNNLGRDAMSANESALLRGSGFDHASLQDLGANHSPHGEITPFIATCSSTAKLLHFSGSAKPWTTEDAGTGAKCLVPRGEFNDLLNRPFPRAAPGPQRRGGDRQAEREARRI